MRWTWFRRMGALVLAAIAILGLALGLAPHRAVLTEIQIAAPPGKVWSILMDTGAYPAWNPQMRLTGALIPGAVIKNQQGLGDEAVIFWPRILAVRPDEKLSWLGRVGMPGILDAKHYFLLRPSGGGLLFIQGEQFHGTLLWMFDIKQLIGPFNAMNRALKTRAEQTR